MPRINKPWHTLTIDVRNLPHSNGQFGSTTFELVNHVGKLRAHIKRMDPQQKILYCICYHGLNPRNSLLNPYSINPYYITLESPWKNPLTNRSLSHFLRRSHGRSWEWAVPGAAPALLGFESNLRWQRLMGATGGSGTSGVYMDMGLCFN